MVPEAVVEVEPADILVEMLTVADLVLLIGEIKQLVQQQVQVVQVEVVMLGKTEVGLAYSV
jgi:hypothetical protein